jgi:hypothetical protein
MKTLTKQDKVNVAENKLTESEKRIIRKYAKAKRIEKKAELITKQLQPKILAMSSKLPSSKDEFATLSFELELLAKIIFVEKFTVDTEKLQTNFAEVYERVKQDSSHIQIRLA